MNSESDDDDDDDDDDELVWVTMRTVKAAHAHWCLYGTTENAGRGNAKKCWTRE